MTSEHSDRSDRLRAFFASYVAARGGAGPRIAEAFAAVPRERFAGPGPWSVKVPGRDGYVTTPDDDPAYLYQDKLVAIDPGRGIHFGEPSLHARCLQAIAPPRGRDRAARRRRRRLLFRAPGPLVGPGGRVHAVEIEPDLAARAAGKLAGIERSRLLRWIHAVMGLCAAWQIGETNQAWAPKLSTMLAIAGKAAAALGEG